MHNAIAIFRWMKVNGGHPNQILETVAEHLRKPVVRMEDLSIFGDRYSFERRFSETSESFFGFSEDLLDSLSLGDFAFELPHHCLKISGTPFDRSGAARPSCWWPCCR